jgi:hypothetical protein
MASVQQMVESDVSVLLLRALLGKTLVAFGDDGLGKHGRCDVPQYYEVQDLDICINLNEADDTADGVVFISLTGYDAMRFGLILSDQNFLLSVRAALDAVGIDGSVLTYAEFAVQDQHDVAMAIDVKRLLDWP